jgi:hypothetical protein
MMVETKVLLIVQQLVAADGLRRKMKDFWESSGISVKNKPNNTLSAAPHPFL